MFLDGAFVDHFYGAFSETIFICNKVSGTFMYVDTYFSIKSKHTRIIKNCEFKKGSRDRSPKQKVRKQEL